MEKEIYKKIKESLKSSQKMKNGGENMREKKMSFRDIFSTQWALS